MTSIDLGSPRRVHVIGVGGAGMSAISEVLVAMGHTVTGSDLKESRGVERLRALGMGVTIGHDPANLGGAELVAISTAIPARNPERVEAEMRGLPVLRRAELLAAITATRRTIAVAGTHGKTTTSSMLALVLREAGMNPSFIIGGDVNEIGSGAVWDTGEWLVVEADESDGTFLELVAEAGIVTSVEPDHIEHYGGVGPLFDAFEEFMAARPGPMVVCADDHRAATMAEATGAITYGLEPGATLVMYDVEQGPSGVSFSVTYRGEPLGRIDLPTPGLHNARNAAAATTMALAVGAPFDAARSALGRFAGVARRFESRGEAAGVTFIDDYAHHPTETVAALGAARSGGWNRIVAVFQPHRYSRTSALWRDFADAFREADLLVVTDVFGAGEAPRPGVTGRLIVEAVLDAHPFDRVAYLPRRDELVGYLRQELRPGDLCLTLGAGDLTSLPDELRPLLGDDADG